MNKWADLPTIISEFFFLTQGYKNSMNFHEGKRRRAQAWKKYGEGLYFWITIAKFINEEYNVTNREKQFLKPYTESISGWSILEKMYKTPESTEYIQQRKANQLNNMENHHYVLQVDDALFFTDHSLSPEDQLELGKPYAWNLEKPFVNHLMP